MIEQGEFECIKRDLTDGVVAYIMESRGLSDDDAIRLFMNSKVYKGLQNKDLEIWHFSVKALSGLFDDEMDGHLEWPVAP